MIKFILSIAFFLSFILTQSVAHAEALKNGWWIRIDTTKTQASTIGLQIGTSKKDRKSWKIWTSNDITEFDLPDEYLNVSELYIYATSNPSAKDVLFSVFYRTDGIQHFDFHNEEGHQMKQTDRDELALP